MTLIEAIKARGLTVAKYARKLGVSDSAIYKWSTLVRVSAPRHMERIRADFPNADISFKDSQHRKIVATGARTTPDPKKPAEAKSITFAELVQEKKLNASALMKTAKVDRSTANRWLRGLPVKSKYQKALADYYARDITFPRKEEQVPASAISVAPVPAATTRIKRATNSVSPRVQLSSGMARIVWLVEELGEEEAIKRLLRK